jgi:hypothetical protein
MRFVTWPEVVMMTTITRCGCSERISMWRTMDVVTAGADTTASSSVTRDSASAVSRSASSISLRARSRSTATDGGASRRSPRMVST